MQEFEPIDDETGIESYPNFLGMMWDLEFAMCDPCLEPMRSFDWNGFVESFEVDEVRKFELDFCSGRKKICIREGYSLPSVLDQIPSIVVKVDIPSDQGPGSGVGHVFFYADGCNSETVSRDISALIASLSGDKR